MPRKTVKNKGSMMEGGMDVMGPGPKSKKRRSSLAVTAINSQGNQVNANQLVNQPPRPPNSQGDLAPPPPSGIFGDTLIAANPFDDSPRSVPVGPVNQPPPGPGPMNVGGFKGNQGPMKGPPTPNPYDDSLQRMGPGGPGSQMPPGPCHMSVGGFKGNQGPMKGPQTPNPSPNPNQMRLGNTQRRPASVGHSPCGPGMGGHSPCGRPMTHMSGIVYPMDQPLIRNSQNQNAPPIYTCGGCHKEIPETDPAILCESGCNFWYHQACTGLTDDAFQAVKKECFVEWACDSCYATGTVPPVKFKP